MSNVQGPLKEWEHYPLTKNGKVLRLPMPIRTGDTVKIISGHDKGKVGKVTKVRNCFFPQTVARLLSFPSLSGTAAVTPRHHKVNVEVGVCMIISGDKTDEIQCWCRSAVHTAVPRCQRWIAYVNVLTCAHTPENQKNLQASTGCSVREAIVARLHQYTG